MACSSCRVSAKVSAGENLRQGSQILAPSENGLRPAKTDDIDKLMVRIFITDYVSLFFYFNLRNLLYLIQP